MELEPLRYLCTDLPTELSRQRVPDHDLAAGLIAQLVEYYIRIIEVMGLNALNGPNTTLNPKSREVERICWKIASEFVGGTRVVLKVA